MELYEIYYKVGFFKMTMYRIFGTSEEDARNTFLLFMPDKKIERVAKAQ